MKIHYNMFLLVFAVLMFHGVVATAEPDINLNKIEKSYWDNGNPRIVRYYYLSGVLEQSSFYRKDGTLERLTGYDRRGNKVSESYYKSDGSLSNNEHGWAAMRREYRKGILYRESFFDEKGHMVRYEQYDKSGFVMADKEFKNGLTGKGKVFNSPKVMADQPMAYNRY